MNTQSEDMMDINFRDRLYDLDMEPSDVINNRIMDSIIDHTQAQGRKRSLTANLVRWASGAALGVAVTAAFFMFRSNDLAPAPVRVAASSPAVAADGQYSRNAYRSVAAIADRSSVNSLSVSATWYRTTDQYLPASSDHIDFQAVSLVRNSFNAGVSVQDSQRTSAGLPRRTYRQSRLLHGQAGEKVTGQKTSLPRATTSSQTNFPDEYHSSALFQYQAGTKLAQDRPLQLIACTNVGDDLAQAEMVLQKDLPLPQQLVHDAAVSAKNSFRGHGVELSAGYESYSIVADEAASGTVSVRRANLLYTAQWGTYELKAGVAVSQSEAPVGCTYSSLRTDTVRSWMEVDSVDASGHQIGKMHYETVQTAFQAQSSARQQSLWISVPVLVGARTEYGRFSGALYGGAVAMQPVAHSYSASLAEGHTLVGYSRSGVNSRTALALCAQVQIGCRIADRAELFVNGEYRRYLYGPAAPRNSVSGGASLGANAGLRFSF